MIERCHITAKQRVQTVVPAMLIFYFRNNNAHSDVCTIMHSILPVHVLPFFSFFLIEFLFTQELSLIDRRNIPN